MLSLNPTELLNPQNVHGGAFTTDKMAGIVNSGNTAFVARGGSPAALRGGGLYSIGDGGSNTGSPSSTQTPLSSSHGVMRGGGGGGRRRKHRRSHKRVRSSKKYARKRSLKYRMKHRRSRSRKYSSRRARAQTGGSGYHQYMGNLPFSQGFRTPGFGLPSSMSALANPAPFIPYNKCEGIV